MVGGYGQDDRSCAFAALAALLETEAPEKTALCYFTDKEEVRGTDLQMCAFKTFVGNLGGDAVLAKSAMLAADVCAGYDPSYASVYDKKTSPYLGKGLALTKSGTGNFASMEFFRSMQNLFDDAGVRWQFGGFGKVGKGGGGTIAADFAALGMEVLDCGIPMLSMHSPFEIISKIDLWTAYRGFKAFLK
jgi:aspartyl aminopeptidase